MSESASFLLYSLACCFLKIPHLRYNTVFIFLCLTYLPSKSIPVVVNGKTSFFLWLSSILLCMCVFYAWEGIGYPLQYSWASLVAQLVKNPPAMREAWVRFLGWEDSPGGGNGCPLQYSGLENSMDCVVHGVAKSLTRLSEFHFHFHAEGELLDHMIVLFWASWEISILFSSVATLIYIPTNSIQRFTFLHITLIFVICVLFDDRHSDRCEVIAHSDLKTVPLLSIFSPTTLDQATSIFFPSYCNSLLTILSASSPTSFPDYIAPLLHTEASWSNFHFLFQSEFQYKR